MSKSTTIPFFRPPVIEPLELKARPSGQLFPLTKFRPANHFTVLQAGSSVISESWKFQECIWKKITIQQTIFFELQTPPANVWHPLHLQLGAQGGYLALRRRASKSPHRKSESEKILGPDAAASLFNYNTFKTLGISGNWSCELPFRLIANLTGKDLQRPQSRHCGNATDQLPAPPKGL